MPDVVYDCQVGAPSSVPNYVRQVTNSGFDPHIEVMAGRESGRPDITDQFVVGGSPEVPLTTVDIGGFLNTFGTLGGQVDGATVLVPYQKRKSGGTFQTGASNMTVAGVTSCPVQMVPHQISAPRQGSPSAQGSLHFLSVDGVTTPYVESVNQSLAAQAFNAMYGLGPVYINGTRVPKLVGYTVHFGLGMSEKQHYDGTVWPSDMFLETTDPVIEVQVEDFDQITSIMAGGPITAVTAYLRKRASGGTYVADATAAHVKFSFALITGETNCGVAIPQALQASETKHGSSAIRLIGRRLIVSTASAVTSP